MKYDTTKTISALSGVAFVCMFVTSGEPAIPLLRGTVVEPVLNALSYPNAIAFNLSAGFLMGAIIWALNVAIPDHRQRAVLRNGLAERYRAFRLKVLSTLLHSYSGDLPEQICEPAACYEYFKSDGGARQTEAMLRLNDRPDMVERIAGEIRLLVREIEYVLQKIDVADEPHAFLKEVTSHADLVLRSGEYGPSELKNLRGLAFFVLFGYSHDSTPRQDKIAAAIERI
ncbi:MAG: hypothetical protein KF871_09620 [Hydrogenophaga sp.]|uniref:hypothetical protein n=1 Tax=Hydrogenophaga sp. TaxID=1904254 RepID=UPI001D714FC5|nr:hypothetical protein [Hydrogenophaga sp.]MBX3610143.1 hypothetical protein [Hydrogenophaga sp.]